MRSPLMERFAEYDRLELSNALDKIEHYQSELKWWQDYAAELQQKLEQHKAAA